MASPWSRLSRRVLPRRRRNMGSAPRATESGIARAAPKRRRDSPPPPPRGSFPDPMLPLLFQLLARDTSGYWQQQVTYRITAQLDESSAVLTGRARIGYVNHSPDTLRDFSVPQYLNAFRPGSRWAQADSAERQDRFQHLKDPDYAFERITAARVMGAEQRPDYPYAPDSTIAHWGLPRPLAPGDSLVAEIAWQARLSTLPRRQGRQGRRFDFAQWYPKVVVYDRYGGAVVHVLYLPEDRATWGHGIAAGRTAAALEWLDTLFGTYQWPQLTNVHRIEGGGTEFPMMVMNGGASLGLIVHETGHQYTMGQFANNEWREGWLDEGFTSFQTGWFFETHGRGAAYEVVEPQVLWLDLHGWSEPVSLVSERFRDFVIYNEMIYAKAQLFYEELRYVVGDAVMRRILRTYFARWKLKHVDEAAFRAVGEEVSRRDLGWLFGQWLHATPLIDYRLQRVERRRLQGGGWRTTVTIERLGDGWMPVEIGDRDTIYAVATGQAAVERVGFTSARRPGRLMLDPRGRTHDWNMLNNREQRWGVGRGAWEVRLDDPTNETVRRDRLVSAWLPVAWSNDFSGVTVGLRERANYFGSYDRGVLFATAATRPGAAKRFGGYLRVTNPLGRPPPTPHVSTTLALWDVEGRAGAALDVARSLRQHLTFGPDPRVGFGAVWMATTKLAYLDRRLWDDGGTVEGGPWAEVTSERGARVFRARAGIHGGVAYWNPGPGIASPDRYDFAAFARATGEASVRTPFWLGARLGLRLFAGGYWSGSDPLKQRRIMVAGADPYETFTNPLLLSAGALRVRPDFHYQAPGDANLRAFGPDLGCRWAVSVNLECTNRVHLRRI